MNRLRERREELGLTQRQVAEMIGMTHPNYQKIESGSLKAEVYLAQRIAMCLRTSVEALWYEEMAIPESQFARKAPFRNKKKAQA